MRAPTPAEVLAVPVDVDGVGSVMSLADFLRRILTDFWADVDFGADCPYGYSGWRYDVYAALIRAGWVAGGFDEDGYVENLDVAAAYRLIRQAIEALGARDE